MGTSIYTPRVQQDPNNASPSRTLLGSNLQNTFLAGPLAYKALPRPQFSQLQQAIFPPYFALQTALPIVLALTWPGDKVLALGDETARAGAGALGLLEGDNVWNALVPIALMFGTSLLNLVLLGPATTKVMRERKHQGVLFSCCCCECMLSGRGDVHF